MESLDFQLTDLAANNFYFHHSFADLRHLLHLTLHTNMFLGDLLPPQLRTLCLPHEYHHNLSPLPDSLTYLDAPLLRHSNAQATFESIQTLPNLSRLTLGIAWGDTLDFIWICRVDGGFPALRDLTLKFSCSTGLHVQPHQNRPPQPCERRLELRGPWAPRLEPWFSMRRWSR